MEELPVLSIIPDLQDLIVRENTIVLQAPPGAGKSTVLPLHLLQNPSLAGKKILMLEPRRLAAKAVATRIAFLLNEQIGKTVGYRVRFESKVSTDTRLEVVTEGVFSRLLLQEEYLQNVGLVIFDEFHERSLHADLAFVLCREIQQVLREDLKILIMSATLNGEELADKLRNPVTLTSKGRQHPVETIYQPQDRTQALYTQVVSVVRRALSEREGDILVFLPGSGEISRTHKVLSEIISPEVQMYPLYGDLPAQQQQKALTPDEAGRRKIILATSIAETSLTIEGIRIVVDSGLSRVSIYNPSTGLSRLETVQVTKDSADQRAGRAGRTAPGTCYRLWSESSQQHLVPHRAPEISDADLSQLVLELFNWGMSDISSLSWITSPPQAAVAQAVDLLKQLGAVKDNRITQQGKEMLNLGTHPRIAHMILSGKENGYLALATDVAAILEEKDPLFGTAGSNIIERLESLRSFRAGRRSHADQQILVRIEKVAAHWRRLLNIDVENQKPSGDHVGLLLAAAYPERVAKRQGKEGLYRLVNGRTARLKEDDPLVLEEWISVAHMDAGAGQGRIFLAAPLDYASYSPVLSEREVVRWDNNTGVVARKERYLGNLLVEVKPLQKVAEDQVVKVLSEVLSREGDKLLNWDKHVEALQARILSLKKWRQDEDWPDVRTESLLGSTEEWLALYLSSVRKKEDLQKLDLIAIIKGLMDWNLLSRLDDLAPEKIKVPTGSLISLSYNLEGNPPVLAVRLQEMFGLLDTPSVNEGRNPVLLHLLSPGYKPVQVTQDLRSFWKNTYPEVRKELRARYSKHHWPEDPWTAEAVRGVKRR